MPIRFIRNDPAGSAPHSNITPSPGRPGATVRFAMLSPPPEQVYATDDADFTYWQAREAAYRTLKVWDKLRGGLSSWQHGSSALQLEPNSGIGLQASYDRQSLRFFRWEVPTTLFVASSTDAVAHEVGHAILDALRPDLWNSPFPEIVAFHEAFADCIALLVALLDTRQRSALFAATGQPENVLDGVNNVSRFAESVALAYGLSFPPTDPSATPRNANNNLQWAFPHTLPPEVPGAGLSSEPHSFSRVFTGCFFDCIRNIYKNSNHTSQNLQKAALHTGELLIEAVENAPEGMQFFRSIAQAMVLAERAAHNGTHQQAISSAFQAHNILLGSSGLVAPSATLTGTASTGTGSVGLVASARKDLCNRVGAPRNTRFKYRKVKLGAKRLIDAAFSRDVDIGRLHKRLENVKVKLSDSVLLDVVRKRYLVMDTIPNAKASEEQAYCLVETLLRNGMLMLDGEIMRPGKSPKTKRRGKKRNVVLDQPAAYSIRKRGSERYVTRLRCVCHTRMHAR